MTYKKLLVVILLLIAFTLFLQSVSANFGTMYFAQEDNAPILKDATLGLKLVSSSLKDPTSMAFIGQNDILVTEKNTGTVQRILDGEILEEPLLDVSVNG